MERHRFGNSDLTVSAIGLGCYGMSGVYGPADDAEAIATIGRALDIAPRLACGVVWINATNLFDAAVGFGGYRESGYGREGGREGIYEYLKPRAWLNLAVRQPVRAEPTAGAGERDPLSNVTLIDRTAKLFIGGKQVRPDSGYSLPVHAPGGRLVGEVGEGNRKDIRNAVEAARAAQKWSQASTHNRAQVLFYLAENLAIRADEFARQLVTRNGATEAAAHAEVEAAEGDALSASSGIIGLLMRGGWAQTVAKLGGKGGVNAR